MPKLKRDISGEIVIKILCNRFGFMVSGQSGRRVRLSKVTAQGKIGTVVPMHEELKPGTLKSVLKLGESRSRRICQVPVNATCPSSGTAALHCGPAYPDYLGVVTVHMPDEEWIGCRESVQK